METVIDFEEMDFALREMMIRIEEARNLLDNGRIIRCDRKLQGLLTKCSRIVVYINEHLAVENTDNEIVADQDHTQTK